MVENVADKVFVQLRLPTELAKRLKELADLGDRTLPGEIIRRVEQSLATNPGDAGENLFAGWPFADQERFRALSNIVGILCARIMVTYGYGPDTDMHVLGALETALAELFSSLGVKKPSADEKKFIAMHARQMFSEIRHFADLKNQSGEKAALAVFAQAWGVRKDDKR